MRLLAALLALVVAAPLLAGCLEPPPVPIARNPLLPDLSDVKEPTIDAKRARLWWEAFVNAYPERQTYTPTNVRAADQLATDLTAAGYQVTTLFYAPQTGEPSPLAAGIRVIVGVKPGTEQPDHAIAWVAHYDSNSGTAYAAYDDGSGTAVAMELARDLAKTPTRKTLMPIFFDAEEQGLLGSQYYVKQMQKEQKVKFDLVIGHDMTGINCPGYTKWPMYQMTGENYADQLVPLEMALYRDQLHLDVGEGEGAKNCIVVLPKHDRTATSATSRKSASRSSAWRAAATHRTIPRTTTSTTPSTSRTNSRADPKPTRRGSNSRCVPPGGTS